MKYPFIPEIPREVANIIEKYQFIAYKQGSPESSVLFWILEEEVQENEKYTSTTAWIENNIGLLAIAIETGKWNLIK